MYDPDQGFPIPIGKVVANLTESPRRLTRSLNDSSDKLATSAKYAKLILGCYRTGDASDPEVFTSALVAVLSHYPEEVMRLVSDPVRGIPGKIKWLPSIKEVRDACESAAGDIARIRHLSSLKREERKMIPQRVSLANVFVPANNPQYQALAERAKTADDREYKHETGGIWVAETWLKPAGYVGRA